MLIAQELEKRKIPALLTFENGLPVRNKEDWAKRREEIMDILYREEYGIMPPAPKNMKAEITGCSETAFAGKAVWSKIKLAFDTPKGEFSFPVDFILPKNEKNPPVILHIAFRPDIPDRYCPAEEVIDNGVAVISFCYRDISDDKEDGFSSGLAAMYALEKRDKSSWGKIGMWAWAAMRVMDYLQTREDIDKNNIAVMGHSRLGKTALLAGAADERFSFVISNNSGCAGAAITREKQGEQVRDICNNYGYWFCENYKKYIDNEEDMPFDQHFLLAAAAPRHLYVSSAEEDIWADPASEYLCCAAASEVYRLYGKQGFVHPDRYIEAGEVCGGGEIGYHLRSGTHFLSRYDWLSFIDYIKKHRIEQ